MRLKGRKYKGGSGKSTSTSAKVNSKNKTIEECTRAKGKGSNTWKTMQKLSESSQKRVRNHKNEHESKARKTKEIEYEK